MIIKLIVPGVFTTASISVCIYLLYQRRLTVRSVLWPSVEATIDYCKIPVATNTNGTPDNWSMRWNYSYDVNGERFQGNRIFFGSLISGILTNEMIDMKDRCKNAEKILVHYDPDDPVKSTVVVGTHRHLQTALIVAFLALGCLIPGNLSVFTS